MPECTIYRLGRCAPLGTIATLSLAVTSLGASAQTLSVRPEPGLWESQTKTLINGQDAGVAMENAYAQMMQNMPPETRERMRAAMGGRMPAKPGGAQRSCLTPEQAARAADPKQMLEQMNRGARECQFEPVEVSGSTVRFKGRCQGERGFAGDMNGELMLDGPKAMRFRYEGRGKVQGMAAMPGMPMPADGMMTTVVEGSSRWLSAACGKVKPRRP